MSAARKAAEEALAEAGRRYLRSSIQSDAKAWARMHRALEGLLAEQTEAGGELISCPACNMVVGRAPLAPPPAPCGGRCEDALDSRSPCPSCAERLAPPPALSFGSTSTACSDSTPAQPLPTCVNCGSNFFTPAPSPARDEVARLTALLHECNAVCLCGCPDGDHEADECGESCGHDDHECVRVPKSVLAYVETLRRAPARDEVREAPGVNVARGLELQKDLAIVTAQAIVGVAHRADVKKARRLLDAWYIDNGERLLAALSSPTAAPARDEVREAAAKLDSACRRKEALSWCGRKACDEVWSSACTLLAAIAARGGE